MGYERYPRGTNPQGDYYGRNDSQDYGRDYGSGRDQSYASGRDYQAAGQFGDDDRFGGRQGYGSRDYGNQRYGQRDQQSGPRDYYGSGSYGGGYDDGRGYGRDRFEGRYGQDRGSQNAYVDRNRYGAEAGRQGEYHGSYGAGGRRFESFGSAAHADDDDDRGNDRGNDRDRGAYGRPQNRSYGRPPQGYDNEDRGFFARAGDEVRSWFGDEDAERRRDHDSRVDEQASNHRDEDYHHWRRSQIQSLDRDYDEYRREHRSKFENEFGSWRSTRQTQREALNKVEEHMDVLGSDGEHVGTVDKVRGDRILLTKTDAEAGGRHHSIPSSWLHIVDDKVTLSKTAADAKRAWRDEERNQAFFGDDNDRTTTRGEQADAKTGLPAGQPSAAAEGKALNRSFSGTY